MTNNPNTNDPISDSISDQASRSTLALNPLVGFSTQDLVDSSIILLNAIAREPAVAVNQFLGFLGEMGNVVSGKSERKPEAGDKRFVDKTWKDSAVHRGLLQVYLAWGDSVNKFIDQTSLSDINKTRAHLIASMLVDAAAPTNNLLSNPAALRHFFDTGGKSLWQGINNFVEDLGKNGGLPSQVDKSPFKVGGNLATTPGAVVFQNETLELIQYVPTTPNVRKRPLVITPPQINKFYSLDLTPEKSLLQFLLKSGIQVFCVSWRNPTAEHRDWGLDTYLVALDEAVDATMEITGSEDISMMGACSGGITSSAYLGMLAGKGQHKVRNIVLAVCVLDVAAVHVAGNAGDHGSREGCIARSRRARWRGARARLRMDAAKRPDLELLGQ
jgi:poly[(R)-3-hydroxyalkanoate] polymerase subunit PhaC